MPGATLLTLLALLQASAAGGQVFTEALPPRPDGVISLDAMWAQYPPQLKADAVTGHVRLDCTVTQAGRLVSCIPVDEAPAGSGFGPAAARLAEAYLHYPPRGDAAAPVHASVSVRFTPPPRDAAAAAAPAPGDASGRTGSAPPPQD